MQMSSCLTLDVPLDDIGEHVWSVSCLVQGRRAKGKSAGVVVPFTIENMQQVQKLCATALGKLGAGPVLPCASPVKRLPRDKQGGGREYWDKNRGRWVSFTSVAKEGQPRKRRTLTRKESKEVPAQPAAIRASPE